MSSDPQRIFGHLLMPSPQRITRHPILAPASEATVEFTFNGQTFLAREGEVISSALFAHGVKVFNRHHKDGEPQGIFCANGQCAQCLLLVDGKPVKSCIMPVREGMDVRSLDGLPELPPDDDPLPPNEIKESEVDVLVVGGGPAGLSTSLELAKAGVNVLIVDDKQELGGKLSLQTHNFFGSIRDCHAGMRGMEIGWLLEEDICSYPTIEIWFDSPVVGVFSDGRVGVVKDGIYHLIRPERMLISTGAREKTLTFPGCDLPGVYGAGAFQTLVNRDMIKAASRLFIVGGGNVGLIGAYHALQAGIDVLGIVEALSQCGGYKVHLDKIVRLGVPVWTSHTILRAEGEGKVEKVTIARVDERFNPVPGTEQTFEVDTLLVAVGLTPVDELLDKARKFGYTVYAAGDAAIIAEASAAIFSGRITGRRMLQDMGFDVEVPDEWSQTLEVLRAKPGPTHDIKHGQPADALVYPVINCAQEIPCNPCTAVCFAHAIKISDGKMTGIPLFEGECLGCTRCVAICPGLAITLVDRSYDPSGETALVTIPWEMPVGLLGTGSQVKTVGFEGEEIGAGTVIAIRDADWQNRRQLLLVEVPSGEADSVAGIKTFSHEAPGVGQPLTGEEDDNIIVCRCERVTKGEVVRYIRENKVTDFNALKAALRVGMGPCGGKTCKELVMRIFYQEMGRDAEVRPHVERPFVQEVPMIAFLGGDER